MKKNIVALSVFIVVSLFGSIAFAGNSAEVENGKTIYEWYGQNGSNVTEFKWTEVPYVLLHLNKTGTVVEGWASPVTNTKYNVTVADNQLTDPADIDGDNKWIRNTLPNWLNAREKGWWTWTAQAVGGSKVESGTFNLVPEPISSALFLLGGGAIAVLKLRKKKI